MTKRPLCCLCLILITIRCILTILLGVPLSKGGAPSPLKIYAKEEKLSVTGQIYKKEQKETYQLLYLKENSVIQKKQSFLEPRILIFVKDKKENPEFKIGNVLNITGNLKFFQKPRNPGNFDAHFFYEKQGIYGQILSDSIVIRTEKFNEIQEGLFVFREQWKKLLVAALGEKDGGALSAIMLGDKSGLEKELQELYQKNGIGHILAISGLHISFIGMGLYIILRKCNSSYIVAGGISIIFLILYVIMVGFSVSTIRAVIMFIVKIIGDITGRIYDMLTALCLSAVIILVWKPLYLFDAGFLLSFGAILGIGIVFPILKEFFNCKKKIMDGLWASISMNLILFPMLLYFYFEFPIYSFLLNLLVIPLMSWLLGMGLVGTGISIIAGKVGMQILRGSKLILRIYETICNVANNLPFARIVFGKPKLWQIAIYYVVLSLLLLWMHREKDQKIHSFFSRFKVVIVGIVMFSSFLFTYTPRNTVSVTMIDVGQGDSIFLRSVSNTTYLIDGGSTDVKGVGKYRIEPFLKSQGVSKLDYVFISHGDLDHYSGVMEMLERQTLGVKIGTLVLPSMNVQDKAIRELANKAMEVGVAIMTIEKGEQIKDGELQIKCIQPDDKWQGEVGNASSMILFVEFKDFEMLFTGDVEGGGEEQLIENLKLETFTLDILKVSHHGSRNSTTSLFLEEVTPRYAWISAGKKNRYGHPHRETMNRLEKENSRIYCTNKQGAISLKTDGKTIQLETFVIE